VTAPVAIHTLLIPNRGEIACRLLASCARLGIRGVVAYSEADADSPAVRLADQAVLLGPAPPGQSYLNIEAILEAARSCGADAIHPGYGFLAENAEFARRVGQAGLIFVGPEAEVIEQMGSKVTARELCQRAGVPVVPGSGAVPEEALLEWAEQHGYPVMLKASAGGGGKGMRRLADATALREAVASARREAEKAFGSSELYLEKALTQARHLEVQVAADRYGNAVHLGVRECSLQRRHQKVIEECPPVEVEPSLLDQLTEAALRLVHSVGYSSLGTVEFLVSGSEFYFLEMNTRLQVEHPVTEAVTGLDLVEWQLAIAEGRPLPRSQSEVVFRGHAVEARVTCEDPSQGFLPATGRVLCWVPCPRARVDDGIASGSQISPHYDSMVAKLICWGEDRALALRRLRYALQSSVLLGVPHNLDFLVHLLDQPEVRQGRLHTELLESLPPFSTPLGLRHLLAAAAARRAPWDPGQSLGAFPQRLAFVEAPEVEVEGTRFTVEGQTYEVSLEPRSLTVDGHRVPVAVAHQGEQWWVHTPDGTARLQAVPRHPVPCSPFGGGGSLKAPMPGSVVEVLVAPGQVVEAGQPLLKLEAMKMEHVICAPGPGVVEAVPYSVGDQVEVGVELLALSLAEPSAAG
jgi:acetyl/propionyl-CoA carboxylase alpha subunit